MSHDVLILGSGPAGYTAAIYAARAGLEPVLISGYQPGGQLTITTEVENYPGFRDPIQGPELMEIMRDQAKTCGTEMIAGEAERVDFKSRPFKVWTGDRLYEAHTVIVATGATAKLLGIASENKFMGFGVSACATCDGPFFKGKRVMVVGGGDTAMEEANYLARLVEKVTVVHRRGRDTLRASKIMQDRAFKNSKIQFVWDSVVDEVLGTAGPSQRVTGVRLRNVKTGALTPHDLEAVFVAIGHQPNTAFLKGQIPMDERGYILVEPGTARTRVPGVFAAGDVQDSVYRQAVTAAGSGCMAAMDAERWLAHERHVAEGHAAEAHADKPAGARRS